MVSRRWSRMDIEDVLGNLHRTIPRRDERYLPDGSRLIEPATAYVRHDGHYIVRRDVDGDIVQISNRKDPNWKSPWE